MKLTIKRVQGMDIGPLRELSLAFREEIDEEYPFMDEAEVDAHMLYVLASKEHPEWIYLIAYDGKKPVGFFTGYVSNHEYSQPRRVAVAQELFVVPAKRGGKVGLRLMHEAFRIAMSLGAQGIECIGSYNGTDKRWEKFGFKLHASYGHIPPEEFAGLMEKFA